jgi:hypothetical protein
LLPSIKPANELIRVRHETDDENEEDVVDASNENEPVCICIPEAQLMVQKLRQFAIKMGRTSLLNKVDLKECYRPHRYHPHPGQLDQYHFHFRWIFFHQTLAS